MDLRKLLIFVNEHNETDVPLEEVRERFEEELIETACKNKFFAYDDYTDPWSVLITAKGYKHIVYSDTQLELFGSEDKGYQFKRTEFNIREKEFQEAWADENVPRSYMNSGFGTLQGLFMESQSFIGKGEKAHVIINHRDRYIAATVIQWLGTNVGMEFLTRVLNRIGYKLVKKEDGHK